MNTEIKAKPGRPVVENSARQLRLKELEQKRANGELRRGRPIAEDSARQQRIKELEEKRSNGELRRGRPVAENSARQQRLKELNEKRANGTLKLGRPKQVTVTINEVPVAVVEEIVPTELVEMGTVVKTKSTKKKKETVEA